MKGLILYKRATSSLFLVPLFLGAFISTLTPLQTYALTAKVSATTYTRLFYYQGGTRARQSFLTHPNSIDIFAPQTYALDDSGQLHGKVDPTLLAFAKKHSIKVMPLVTNDGFDTTGIGADTWSGSTDGSSWDERITTEGRVYGAVPFTPGHDSS